MFCTKIILKNVLSIVFQSMIISRWMDVFNSVRGTTHLGIGGTEELIKTNTGELINTNNIKQEEKSYHVCTIETSSHQNLFVFVSRI